MKVFISQPMRGKTNEEIKAQREKAIEIVKFHYPCMAWEDIEEIPSYFESAPAEACPLWYLGEALKLMSTADVVVFCKNWESARGCRIEHEAAKAYDLTILYEK